MSEVRLNRTDPAYWIKNEFGVCDACGLRSHFRYEEVVNDRLATDWKMDTEQKEMMSRRESMYCFFCGSSYRLRLLSRAIQFVAVGNAKEGLERNIEQGNLNKIDIAEINSCGVLHNILKYMPKLSYSEYVPNDDSVHHQDLQGLTYDDSSFDIVLTSDVLEHVPDPVRALEETFRVLRPGGVHLMTIPILLDRKTKTRVKKRDNGEIEYMTKKSFHGSGEEDYLVWTEFGADVIEMCQNAGFEACHLFDSSEDLSISSGIILAVKPGENSRLNTKVPVTDDVEIESRTVSDSRIAEMEKKLRLTLDHAQNLQGLLAAYQTEEEKKTRYIQELESRGIKYYLRQQISSLGNSKRHR